MGADRRRTVGWFDSTGADVTFRRPSFYFVQGGGLERHAAKPHPATSTTSSGFRAAFQRWT